MSNSINFRRCLAPVLIVALVALPSSSSRAASRFWDGSVNGNFSTAGNWVGSVAPVAGDDLVFQPNDLVSRFLVTNDFSPNRAFNSIAIEGSNYFIRGNAIFVTNGITTANTVGTNRIDADVDVRGPQAWEATGALGVLDVNGDVNLNTNTLIVRANTGDFFFSGIISGTGNLVKTNVGTLRLDGAGHNTYSGFTRLDGGVLELDKFSTIPASNYVAVSGDLIIGDGNGLLLTDVCRLLVDDQIANTSGVTVKNSGLFDLNGHDNRVATLAMRGGTVDTGAGTLFLGGNLTTMSDPNTALIEGHLSLGGASRIFDIAPGPPAADLRINAMISSDTVNILAAAGFTKEGGGSLFLAGTNTYNGATTINNGQVALLSNRALGATTAILGNAAPTVVNATGNLFLSGVQVTNEDLTINSTNPGGAFNASGASVWTGNILLNTATFIASSGSLLLNGSITGSGGFTKLAGGSITLAGTNANTYSGTTTVRDGTLLLDKTPLDGAMAGLLVIGEDELPENTDVVRYLRVSQLPDDTDVIINSSGLLDLNGFGENVGNIIFNGGDLDTGTASILPTGNITVNRNTNSQAIISGHMSVLSNPIIDVTGHYFSPDLSITAQLFGAGGFTKNGIGEVGLFASNNYSGLTTVNDGFVLVNDSFALGATNSGTVVKSGAVLGLNFGVAVPAEPLTLAGGGQSVFGALSSGFGSNSWAGSITLSANATIYADAGNDLNLTGPIDGNFDITKTGTGTLLFSGGSGNTFANMAVSGGTLVLDKTIANASFAGDLTIGDDSGTDVVRLNRDNQIGDNVAVHIFQGAGLDLNGMVETTGSIDGRGAITLGSGTLRAGTDNGSSAFGGMISGTGTLFKLGTGTWVLAGNNTYSGQTTVSAGTLIVNGFQPQSPVTVNGTATLGGAGTVGDLDVFGNLRPGNGPGMLTSGNFVFHSSAADYFVELNGVTPGTAYDQLRVLGTAGLGNATLHVSLGFVSSVSNTFTIIDNDGSDAVTNTFNGLPEGATVFGNGIPFQISYTGGSGNDVVLTQLADWPQLRIEHSGNTNVVLSWPTNFSGFTLEANTNLNTNVWSAVSPAPSVSSSNNVVTNATTQPQSFYRLRNP
jgi:autotransporter-associated beta strand protein